jgi:hypothetical protein
VANVFSQFLNANKNQGVPDRTIDALLFLLRLKWLYEMYTYISTEKFLEDIPQNSGRNWC